MSNIKNGLEVVLNGGKSTMDNATIPIEWWLSRRVIDQNPTHVFFFEQNGFEKGEYNRENLGRRYVARIDEKVKYLQLFSPGYHRVMVLVLGGGDVESDLKYWFKSERQNQYGRSLDWEAAAEGWISGGSEFEVLASTVVEFEVPEVFFAQRPKSGLQKWLWDVNLRVYGSSPKDECHNRKRLMLMPLYLLLMAVLHLIFGTIYAAYVLVASLFIFFWGFRPKPLLKEMWKAFMFQRPTAWDVRRFTKYDSPDTYLLWSTEGKTGQYKSTYMPIAPFQVVFLAGVAWLAWAYFQYLGLLLALGLALVVVGFVVLIYKYTIPATEYVWESLQENRLINRHKHQMAHKEWLLENFTIEKKRDVVDISQLPKPLSLTAQTVQKFRVSFWALKAKVCKPYSK